MFFVFVIFFWGGGGCVVCFFCFKGIGGGVFFGDWGIGFCLWCKNLIFVGAEMCFWCRNGYCFCLNMPFITFCYWKGLVFDN